MNCQGGAWFVVQSAIRFSASSRDMLTLRPMTPEFVAHDALAGGSNPSSILSPGLLQIATAPCHRRGTFLLSLPLIVEGQPSPGTQPLFYAAQKRANAWQRTATLVVSLSVSPSMILICIIPEADSLAWWRLFLQSDLFAPRYVEILVPTVVMVLATLMVLVCFARSAWALRVLSTTPPQA